jgi:hypothetical protein
VKVALFLIQSHNHLVDDGARFLVRDLQSDVSVADNPCFDFDASLAHRIRRRSNEQNELGFPYPVPKVADF